MKLNWKLRFKNPLSYIALLGAIVLPVLQYFNMSLEDFTTWGIVFVTLKDSIMNPFVLGSMIWAVILFFIDPTTKGISDSERALGYKELKK